MVKDYEIEVFFRTIYRSIDDPKDPDCQNCKYICRFSLEADSIPSSFAWLWQHWFLHHGCKLSILSLWTRFFLTNWRAFFLMILVVCLSSFIQVRFWSYFWSLSAGTLSMLFWLKWSLREKLGRLGFSRNCFYFWLRLLLFFWWEWLMGSLFFCLFCLLFRKL